MTVSGSRQAKPLSGMVASRCIDIPQNIEQPGRNKTVLDRGNAPGVFRMALTGIMLMAFTVAYVGDRQGCFPLL
jgi:hypothetical protein